MDIATQGLDEKFLALVLDILKSERQNPLMLSDTTYCQKHRRLERVERVDKVLRHEEPDGFAVNEVHAHTEPGCKVTFIGTSRWR